MFRTVCLRQTHCLLGSRVAQGSGNGSVATPFMHLELGREPEEAEMGTGESKAGDL